MASEIDQTEFVDTDVHSPTPAVVTSAGNRSMNAKAPSREELDNQSSDVQSKLAELQREQQELERERQELESGRSRKIEFQTGREEMLHQLTRGVALLEKAEHTARRDAEQMSKTLMAMRTALSEIDSINEESWTKDNWNLELTRALTAVEESRNEWDSALLQWPILDAARKPVEAKAPNSSTVGAAMIGDLPFGQLCRIGFALTWPVALAAIAILIVLILR